MARPKRYASEAEKQAAYRLRKKGLGLGEKEAVVQTESGGSDVVTPELKASEQCLGIVYSDDPASADYVPPPAQPLTATDRKFEDANIGYYIYGNEVKKRECSECGKTFSMNSWLIVSDLPCDISDCENGTLYVDRDYEGQGFSVELDDENERINIRKV